MASTGDLIAGRYRLLGRVGRGGMGVVWHARDQLLNRSVAVKELVLQPDMAAVRRDEAVNRFRREGRSAAQLHHPNVTVVHDVAEHDGAPFLIMEYVPSRSLAELLADRLTIPVPQVARIGFQMASALAAAHAAGIVHRDVKPANVLLTADGIAKLTDFGIARSIEDDSLTPSGMVVGTPAYLAPEVAQGKDADFRSDVYSLGATLYRSLEGSAPYGEDENGLALLHRVANTDPRPLTTRGPLADVVRQMLVTDPTRRPTIAAARVALERASTEDPTVVMPVPGADRRRRLLPVTFGVAAIAVVAVGILVATRGFGSNDRTAGAGPTTPVIHSSVAGVQPNPVAVAGTSTPTQTTSGTSDAGTATGTDTSIASDVSEQLQSALVGYYALLPAHPELAWVLMSPDNQAKQLGGYDKYAEFWSRIQQVDLSQIQSESSSTVLGTVTFLAKTGGTDIESLRFFFVMDQGVWKIDKSLKTGAAITSG